MLMEVGANKCRTVQANRVAWGQVNLDKND